MLQHRRYGDGAAVPFAVTVAVVNYFWIRVPDAAPRVMATKNV